MALYNPINPLGDKKAGNAKHQQPRRNAPEPSQAILSLPRHKHVHAPHTRNDIHGQDNGSQDGELAEYIGGLFLTLVHFDVDLSEVVGVRAGEEAVRWVDISVFDYSIR